MGGRGASRKMLGGGLVARARLLVAKTTRSESAKGAATGHEHSATSSMHKQIGGALEDVVAVSVELLCIRIYSSGSLSEHTSIQCQQGQLGEALALIDKIRWRTDPRYAHTCGQ